MAIMLANTNHDNITVLFFSGGLYVIIAVAVVNIVTSISDASINNSISPLPSVLYSTIYLLCFLIYPVGYCCWVTVLDLQLGIYTYNGIVWSVHYRICLR